MVQEASCLVVTATHEDERHQVYHHTQGHDVPLVAGVVLLPVDGAGGDGRLVSVTDAEGRIEGKGSQLLVEGNRKTHTYREKKREKKREIYPSVHSIVWKHFEKVVSVFVTYSHTCSLTWPSPAADTQTRTVTTTR